MKFHFESPDVVFVLIRTFLMLPSDMRPERLRPSAGGNAINQKHLETVVEEGDKGHAD